MLRSVFTRVCTMSELAISKFGQSQRLIHTGSLMAASKAGFLKPVTLRTLGGIMQVHDTKAKGDDELINFLSEEISTEKKNQRPGALPTRLDGFEIQANQSEIVLNKKFNNEQVTITLNVNHTVDADYNEDVDKGQQQQTEKDPEMRSRPNFEIDIQKGSKTLSFSCSYLQDAAANQQADPTQQDEYQDAFVIEEISISEGEFTEEIYAVAGDILDGYLYDLFMNMLEERGITNEFVEKLSDYATDYEHNLYIGLLSQLQTFLTSK